MIVGQGRIAAAELVQNGLEAWLSARGRARCRGRVERVQGRRWFRVCGGDLREWGLLARAEGVEHCRRDTTSVGYLKAVGLGPGTDVGEIGTLGGPGRRPRPATGGSHPTAVVEVRLECLVQRVGVLLRQVD